MSTTAAPGSSGADVLAKTLVRHGVAAVFAAPTRQNLPLVLAIRRHGLRLVAMTSPQSALAAAVGSARRTGRIGVAINSDAMLSLGAMPAALEALGSSAPVVLIDLDDPATADLATPVGAVPEGLEITTAGDLQTTLAQHLMALADGQAGPLLVRMRAGVATSSAAIDADEDMDRPVRTVMPKVEHVQLRRAANLVDGSQQVLIWAGGGAMRANASGAVAELAEKIGAPVVTTVQAAGLLPARHPCLVGLPADVPRVGALWDAADVVIAIGTGLDDTSTQGRRLPEPANLIAINLDAVSAGRRYRPDVLLRGDAATITKALSDTVSYRGGTAVVRSRLQEVRSGVLEDLTASDPAEMAFVDAVTAAIPDRATVVTDHCLAGGWIAAFNEWTLPRSLISPTRPDTRGMALATAIGGATAGSTEPVVAVTGDQGALLQLGDLATVAREKLPLTLVIVDDGGSGHLRPSLAALGQDPAAFDLTGPDLAASARTFGLRADVIDSVGPELTDALRAHIAAPDPTVLVITARLRPPPSDPSRWYRAAAT